MFHEVYQALNSTPALGIMFVLIVLGVFRERALQRDVDLWRNRAEDLLDYIGVQHTAEVMKAIEAANNAAIGGTAATPEEALGPSGITGATHPIVGGWDGQ